MILLTASEVAVMLRCSKAAVYALARSRAIGHVRLGGLVRFRPEDVEAYIAAAYHPPLEVAHADTTTGQRQRVPEPRPAAAGEVVRRRGRGLEARRAADSRGPLRLLLSTDER
jgi:excisionase family DNA binding protein